MKVFDEEMAKEAVNLYAAIANSYEQIRRIKTRTEDLSINLQIHGRRPRSNSAGYQNNAECLLASASMPGELGREIVEFALRRHAERLQARINEHGRRLAQLGYTKPEYCK